MTASKKQVGDIVRSARESRDLSQAALAKKSAVSESLFRIFSEVLPQEH